MSVIGPKSRIAILRGGPSEEYSLSMNTGTNLLKSLMETDYQVDDIIVSKAGEWLKNGIVKSPQDALSAVDAVIIALHGAYGEDGTVQRILDRHSIPYAGSGPFASTLCFNKILAKERLVGSDILLPKHMRVSQSENINLARLANTIGTLFGPSYVIKPINSGASFGLRYAEGLGGLTKELEQILQHYDDVLVEERIIGVPVTCGVLENFRDDSVYTFPVVQYVSNDNEILDVFKAEKITPANLKSDIKAKIAWAAKTAHNILDCSQYSRSDFMVDQKGEVYFLETNTLPSLAVDAPYTVAIESVGASLRDVIDHLLLEASWTK